MLLCAFEKLFNYIFYFVLLYFFFALLLRLLLLPFFVVVAAAFAVVVVVVGDVFVCMYNIWYSTTQHTHNSKSFIVVVLILFHFFFCCIYFLLLFLLFLLCCMLFLWWWRQKRKTRNVTVLNDAYSSLCTQWLIFFKIQHKIVSVAVKRARVSRAPKPILRYNSLLPFGLVSEQIRETLSILNSYTVSLRCTLKKCDVLTTITGCSGCMEPMTFFGNNFEKKLS